jgi:hypothetical protein
MDTDHSMQTNPEVAYERRDLGARNIFLFFAILFIAGVIIHFVVWGVYGFFDKVILQAAPQTNPMKPYAKTPSAEILQNTPMVNLDKFAQPRLQNDEPADMRTMNTMEDQVLNGKPWVDANGAVHLPIQVAMDDLLKKGLPTRAEGGTVTGAFAKTEGGANIENAPGTMNTAPAGKQ